MTSPTYEEQAARISNMEESLNNLQTKLAAAELRLDRQLVHKIGPDEHALCGKTPGYMSSIRLTRENANVVCKECFDRLLAASEETVRQLHEAVRLFFETAVLYEGDWHFEEHCTSRLRDLAAKLPDGASALSEVAKLRGDVANLTYALREISHYGTSIPLGMTEARYDRAAVQDMKVIASGVRAALGERSSQEGEGSSDAEQLNERLAKVAAQRWKPASQDSSAGAAGTGVPSGIAPGQLAAGPAEEPS